MTRITIPVEIINQVRAATGPIEFVDEQGKTVATGVTPAHDDCPHSEDDLRRILRDEPARPLAEIWKSLGVK